MVNGFLRLFARSSVSASVVFGIAFIAVGAYILSNGHLIAAVICFALGLLALVAALLQFRLGAHGETADDKSDEGNF